MSTTADPVEARLVAAFSSRRHLPGEARRALLHATELLSCACLLALHRLSDHFDPRAVLLARLRKTRFLLAQAEDEKRLLRGRIERIQAQKRPHYAPEGRFQILCHKARYLLSAAETGRRFGVSAQTVLNWLDEAQRHPERETIGSLLKPTPPVRRVGDVVRQLVRDMKRHGFGGDLKVAQTLTRAAWKLSARSVGRFRKESVPAPPRPTKKPRAQRPVHARHANHIWSLDLTEIPTLFRFFSWKLCVVLDLFSRFPLAARLFLKEPTAEEIAALVTRAAERHGRPALLLSDQGSQFTAEGFGAALRCLGIAPRRGAIGSSGSIAVIERFWKTLKGAASLRSLFPSEVGGRLELTLLHYAYHRPHQSLGGRTPAEVYFNLPQHVPVSAPRGRPGQSGPDPPVAIAFLEPDDYTMPILIPAA